jgi:NAD(P)-dependent dehydrogenase (short-subunit alcohol dehydrogenase family)
MTTDSENRTLKELFDLKGRVALVIGGTGYLGSAMSEALAEAGAKVAIGSRSQERADAALKRLCGGADTNLGLICDALDEDCIRRCVDQVTEHFGRLDVLVTSVVGGTPAGIDNATYHDLEESLTVNLIAPFVASQQAAVHMRTLGGGSIIHIGSMYGLVSSYPVIYEGVDNSSPPAYHAAKGGLIHLTRYQAIYWAKDKIRVNCISPGPFPRPIQHAGRAEFLQRLGARVPLGRTGVNWEIKGAVVFLASEASSFITGHNLVVDGGWTAW